MLRSEIIQGDVREVLAVTQPRCSICGREEGHKAMNRAGERDLNPDTPLGPMETCSFCGTLSVCPDCVHERDCCDEDNLRSELRVFWGEYV